MLYIQGGNKEQIELSRQLFSFCCNGLFKKNNIPNIDLTIHKVEGALAWTDYEGEGKFFIEIEESLNIKNLLLQCAMSSYMYVNFCQELRLVSYQPIIMKKR